MADSIDKGLLSSGCVTSATTPSRFFPKACLGLMAVEIFSSRATIICSCRIALCFLSRHFWQKTLGQSPISSWRNDGCLAHRYTSRYGITTWSHRPSHSKQLHSTSGATARPSTVFCPSIELLASLIFVGDKRVCSPIQLASYCPSCPIRQRTRSQRWIF